MGSRKDSVVAAGICFSDEDRGVDPHLGYPRAYAKLCRNACAWLQLQGFLLPHADGPPRAFLPYTARPEEVAKLEQVQDLFPIVLSDSRKEHPSHLHKFKDVLWQQLDHLGNAGFDPACFRVDSYGNVLYWHADPASPLAWEVCHWFPYSRGGKTVLNNLRLAQWQVSLKKKEKLEFLIPWWDLQLGVSINQFLTAFDSPNIGFRQRCFSFFFLGGEDELPDGKTCINDHQWSHHFLEKKKRSGLAVAGLVRLQKGDESANSRLSSSPSGLHQKDWTISEEDALLRGYQKFGFGNWKAIKESEPLLTNRSLVQIRDKYRSLTGLQKENLHSPSCLSPLHSQDGDTNSRILSSIKRESKIKLLREEEKHMREGESSKLKQALQSIKDQNEQEKASLDTLEAELRKQRKQVEKQRQWNETQASYRICLERMIQETMHQSVVYKEESRLNEIACNSLMAQLESQAETCNAAESRLLHNAHKRQDLLQMTKPVPLLESGSVDEECVPEKSSTQLVKADRHAPPKKQRSSTRDREVLKARDLQNHPPANVSNKQDSFSDSEDQHRSHKRFRKSTTPAKSRRSQSAPRQRLDKENSVARRETPAAPASAKPSMDRIYYEGGTAPREADDGSNIANAGSDGEGSEVTRTFKLMPVIKRDKQNTDSGYASCGSQRFKGILHAPQSKESRDSSERFEIDVSAIDSRVTAGSSKCSRTPSARNFVELHSPEARKALSERGEMSCDEESIKEGKNTLDKWLQILLTSTEQVAGAEKQDPPRPETQDIVTKPEIEQEEAIQLQPSQSKSRGWPEDIAVPPPGLARGFSQKIPEERAQAKKSSSDKLKVPFSGLLRRLSLRQQHGATPKPAATGDADAKDPPRRQVTFEDWEGISTKLVAMNIDSGSSNNRHSVVRDRRDAANHHLRSASARGSTSSPASKNTTSSVIAVDPSPPPPKLAKSVLYYSTDNFRGNSVNRSHGSSNKENQGENTATTTIVKHHPVPNLKAMSRRTSRRASIDECAQAWKNQVSRLESQQQQQLKA
ncbi:uncharacterized protein LOC9637498 [Selaginella moellendorffii]|nr:uncharacterized protein LOC9637498 [Selaginella moellendorffii]|eukprot:XP_002973051.2 uncharacterized protein LOC9637498 [Selaginella moellendorffii]